MLANGICETPVGAKASMRPRSASARGGSLAAHGKRVYSICGNRRANFLPRFFSTRHLMMGDILRPYGTSTYFAVYRFCVNNNNLLVGRVIAGAIFERMAIFYMTSFKRYFLYHFRPL